MPKLNQRGVAHILLILILLVGIAGGVYLVTSGNPLKLFSRAFNSGSVDELTYKLVQLNTPQTGRSAQSLDVEEMIKTASNRKELLLKAAELSPEAFLLYAKLNSSDFPTEISHLIEKRVTLTGQLQVLHTDDFENKASDNQYLLSSSGRTYEILFKDGDPDSSFPKQVSVSGISLEDKVVLHSTEQVSSSGRSAQDFTVPANINLALILFKFPQTEGEPFTKESVYDKVITAPNSVKKYFEEVSFNKVTINAQVLDWVTIDSNPEKTCDTTKWESEALEKLKENGIDVSSFNRLGFVFPEVDYEICSFGGSASGERFNINGEESVQTYAHELGHALGLAHASSLDCNQKPIDHYANCYASEYGDGYDVMGYGYHHINAPHKASLGWIPQENVQTITGDGVYKVTALEKSAKSIQALRISRANINDDYYIEYRQPVGFDSNLPASVTSGALIHIAHEDRNGVTKIIRTAPKENWEESFVLSDGEGFIDSINGVSIQQLSHDGESVTVSVRFITPTLEESELLTGFRKAANPPSGVHFNKLISANGFTFGIEGYSLDKWYRSKVRSDGSLGEWSVVSPPFNDSFGFNAVAKGEFIYVTDEKSADSGPSEGQPVPTSMPNTPVSWVLKYSRVTGGGDIDGFKEANTLPGYPLSPLALIDDKLVALFFGPAEEKPKFYTSKINEDGSLQDWVPAFGLPGDDIYPSKIVGSNNNIFLSSTSFNFNNGEVESKLYSRSLNPDGENAKESWSQINLLKKLFNPEIIATNNYLLVMGGDEIQKFGYKEGFRFVTQYGIYFQEIPRVERNPSGATAVSAKSGWLDATPLARAFNSLQATVADNKLIIAGVDYGSRPGSAVFYSTLKAGDSTPPPPVPESPSPSKLGFSCLGSNQAQLTWLFASKDGQKAMNYTLRVNKEPFEEWAPNEGGGDLALQVGTNTNYSLSVEPSARYGFSVQAGFSDGTVSEGVNGPQFSCLSTPSPFPTPQFTPVPIPN